MYLGHVAVMWETNSYKTIFGESCGRTQLGRPKRRREINNEVNLIGRHMCMLTTEFD